MASEAFRAAAVRRRVEWRDLVALAWWERVWELSLSVPWLVGSVWAYWRAGAAWAEGGSWFAWLGLAALGSFFFFLTGLRQSHNAQHSCLGIGRWGHHAMLCVLSVLMLASMHAVRITHLHHHRHCLDDEDEEARHAAWPWWKVLAMGPVLIVRLHAAAWRLGGRRDRAWIALELALCACAALVVFLVLRADALGGLIVALRWHMAAMAAGECMTAFFAVWIVHRGCEHDGQIARTQRGWMKNLVSYSMFYHLEHHLWPAVPTCHLPRLADRLDKVEPGVRERQVV